MTRRATGSTLLLKCLPAPPFLWQTRMLYNKMVSSSSTSLLPPFISVDGYGVAIVRLERGNLAWHLLTWSRRLRAEPTLRATDRLLDSRREQLCCDFTEGCSKEEITTRERSVRMCIHKYGQCTGAPCPSPRWNIGHTLDPEHAIPVPLITLPTHHTSHFDSRALTLLRARL